jgi:ABC-type glycerol-3-phosphate transport system substrate-binding protein
MKKVKLFLSALVLGIALAACGGIDSKIDALEKAYNDNDLEKVAEISAELEEEKDDMSDAQKERVAGIVLKNAFKGLK